MGGLCVRTIGQSVPSLNSRLDANVRYVLVSPPFSLSEKAVCLGAKDIEATVIECLSDVVAVV